MIDNLQNRVKKLESIFIDESIGYEISIIDKREGNKVHVCKKMILTFNSPESKEIDCDEWIEDNNLPGNRIK